MLQNKINKKKSIKNQANDQNFSFAPACSQITLDVEASKKEIFDQISPISNNANVQNQSTSKDLLEVKCTNLISEGASNCQKPIINTFPVNTEINPHKYEVNAHKECSHTARNNNKEDNLIICSTPIINVHEDKRVIRPQTELSTFKETCNKLDKNEKPETKTNFLK